MTDIYGTNEGELLQGRAFEHNADHQNIYGLGGNDDLRGHGDTNHLYGGEGNDTLLGINTSGQNDELTGGSGADTFVLRSAYSSDTLYDDNASIHSENAVEIRDYNSAEDTIQFSHFENEDVYDFYTVHYGTGDSTSSFIHDEGSGEMVAAIFGDYYDLPPVDSR